VRHSPFPKSWCRKENYRRQGKQQYKVHFYFYGKKLPSETLVLIPIIICVVGFPQFATKNHAVTLSLLPLPRWDGKDNQKEKKQKLMGRDESSLTNGKGRRKQQSIILIKSIYNRQCSHHSMLSLLLSNKSLSFSQIST